MGEDFGKQFFSREDNKYPWAQSGKEHGLI